MMPICYVLVLLSLLLVLADSKSTNSRRDRYWKAKMDRCEAELCSQFLPDEGYNCVNKVGFNCLYIILLIMSIAKVHE